MNKKISMIAVVVVLLLTMFATAPAKADGPCGQHVAIDATRPGSYTPSFSSAISALEAEGYTVDVWRSGSITASRLANVCVLVIVFPHAAYSESEVAAILGFVNSGNGLLFLGEYGKNWYNLSDGVYPAAADPIIGPLGVSINDDLLYDPTDHEVTTTAWPEIHTFPGAHPITDGIGVFMPAGGATLVVTSPGTTIATGDDDTYAVDPVGPDPESDSPSVVTGTGGSYEPVMAASTYGMGRAVVTGDHNWMAGGWSSYYDNIPLFVNVIKWLCPCVVITVQIDIKPGSDPNSPNSINLGDQGLLPVAVLGSPTFDVYTIDLFKPITLGGTGVTSRGSAKAPKLAVSYEDVNEDGEMDLVAFFSVPDLVTSGALHETTTELMLEAETTGGVLIQGIDSVRVVPPE